MRLQTENLGKVAITIAKDYWNPNDDYDKLLVVQVKSKFATYISRKPVPAGTPVTDREYWIPFSSLKEDIVLDYNSFLERYGEELKFLHGKIDQIDKILEAAEHIIDETSKIKEDVEFIKTTIDSAGSPGGIVILDDSGHVPAEHLPSFVDDVVEYPTREEFPAIGEKGKIYVDIAKNDIYRWSGSTYILISNTDLINGIVDKLSTFLGMDLDSWKVTGTTYLNNSKNLLDALKTIDRNLGNRKDELKETWHHLIKELTNEDSFPSNDSEFYNSYKYTQSNTRYLNNAGSIIDADKILDNEIYKANQSINNLSTELNKTNGKLLVLESNARLSVSISPGVVYKNEQVTVTINVSFTNTANIIADVLKVTIDGNVRTVENANTLRESTTVTPTDTITYRAEAEVKGVTLTASAALNARNPVYCGFGTSASSVAIIGNRLSARTSAIGTHSKTATANNVNFFLLVPTDVTAPSNFTMGGAPYVMNKTSETINGVTYNVFKSGATYNSGATVTIIAS